MNLNQAKGNVYTLWDRILAWIPQLLGAIVILIITYIVAKSLDKATEALLHRIRLADHLRTNNGGQFILRIMPRPEYIVGRIVYWLIFIWGLTLAVGALGVPALNQLISGIYHYLPNVLAAIIIFLVASAITAAVDAAVLRLLGDTPTGKLAAAIAPVIIMGIAVFMILVQLRIAPQIVTITYAGLIGSLFLGLALAFGLGGKDVANQILQRAYDASIHPDAQYKKDLAAARERAQQEAKKAKNNVKRAA